MSDLVLSEQAEGVARVTLNRPQKLNALTPALIDQLLATFERLAGDDTVRALILSGAGRGFCAGGDVGGLAESSGAGGGGEGLRPAQLRGYFRSVELLREMPKLTIAAVNGPAAGAGFALACACDVRYAARSAIFTSAFLVVGSSGDYGGAWTLPRIVGEARAREIYLLPERIDAEEAERIGLVSRVLDDGELLDHAGTAAARAAGMPPLSLAAMKENFNDAAGEPRFSRYLDREAERFVRIFGTRDAAEAARAFVEKRTPRFEGR